MSGNTLDEHNSLFLIDLGQPNLDNFRGARLYGAPDECGLDGQFAVPTIDQDAKAYAFRAPKIKEPIHCSANRAPGVQHVVHDHEILVIHRKRNIAGLQNRLGRDFGKIVAIKRDVQRSYWHIHSVNTSHRLRDSFRQGNAAPAHADQRQVHSSAAFLDNFVGKTLNRAIDFRRRHELRLFDDAHRATC